MYSTALETRQTKLSDTQQCTSSLSSGSLLQPVSSPEALCVQPEILPLAVAAALDDDGLPRAPAPLRLPHGALVDDGELAVLAADDAEGLEMGPPPVHRSPDVVAYLE